MGMWSYFDNDSDSVHDYWDEFVEKYPIFDDESNLKQYWFYVSQFIHKNIETKNDDDSKPHWVVGFILCCLWFIDNPDIHSRGIAYMVIEQNKKTFQQQKKEFKQQLSHICIPKNIRNIATKYIQQMIQEFNQQEWKSPRKRLNALYLELDLFTMNNTNCNSNNK